MTSFYAIALRIEPIIFFIHESIIPVILCIKILLVFCKKRTRKYKNVEVRSSEIFDFIIHNIILIFFSLLNIGEKIPAAQFTDNIG